MTAVYEMRPREIRLRGTDPSAKPTYPTHDPARQWIATLVVRSSD